MHPIVLLPSSSRELLGQSPALRFRAYGDYFGMSAPEREHVGRTDVESRDPEVEFPTVLDPGRAVLGCRRRPVGRASVRCLTPRRSGSPLAEICARVYRGESPLKTRSG